MLYLPMRSLYVHHGTSRLTDIEITFRVVFPGDSSASQTLLVSLTKHDKGIFCAGPEDFNNTNNALTTKRGPCCSVFGLLGVVCRVLKPGDYPPFPSGHADVSLLLISNFIGDYISVPVGRQESLGKKWAT